MSHDLQRQPQHIAVIMDGNGRWAEARGRPRTVGHRYGVEAMRRFVHGASEFNIPYLTFFGFSTENWQRSAREVGELMWLLRTFIQHDFDDLHDNGVRIRVIGERPSLPLDLQHMLDRAERRTAANNRITVTLALNYGGRQDILQAVRTLAHAAANGALMPDVIDHDRFARELSTFDIPDPDLLLRTSGEQRISNFLLWQCAYTEMVFLDKLWPDIDANDVRAVVEIYQARDRRFGSTTSDG